MTYESEEKLEKFMRVIGYEMDERRKLFAKESAQSFTMYNEVSKEKLPAIFIAVDNYDVLKEIELETDPFFARLSRDGAGIGIYLIASAGSSASMRYNVLAGFKNKISFYQYEQGELTSLIGRSEYKLPEIRGRALANFEGINVVQCYLPVLSDTQREYVSALTELISKISGLYSGVSKAKSSVAMLPDEVSIEDLKFELAPKHMISIGLDSETVSPAYLDMREGMHLIVGKPKSGKSNVLKLILLGIKEGKKFICDTNALELRDYAKGENISYIYSEDGKDEFLAGLKAAVEEREASFKEHGKDMLPREYYMSLEPVSLVIDDADSFIKLFASDEIIISDILKRLIAVSGSIFISVGERGVKSFDQIANITKEAQNGIILGNPSEQYVFSVNVRNSGNEKAIGYLYSAGIAEKIKMPKI
jgi:S-DNA-T family DNA segregation ATPase FtsK/SpoIIIE